MKKFSIIFVFVIVILALGLVWWFLFEYIPGFPGAQLFAPSRSDDAEMPASVIEYAEQTYRNEPQKKAAFLQSARYEHAKVTQSYSRDKLIELGNRAGGCQSIVFKFNGESADVIKKVTSLVVNSKEKIRVWSDWNKSFSGQFLTPPEPRPEDCDG